jgi:hypothetical protein
MKEQNIWSKADEKLNKLESKKTEEKGEVIHFGENEHYKKQALRELATMGIIDPSILAEFDEGSQDNQENKEQKNRQNENNQGQGEQESENGEQGDEGNEQSEEKEPFFEGFEKLSKAEQELIRLRWENVINTMRAYRYNKDRSDYFRYLLSDEERKIKEQSKSAVPELRTPMTDAFHMAVRKYEKAIKDLEDYSPESFIALHLQEFKKQIANIQEGRIMETNYVKNMRDWTTDQLERGSHIFLHGHLGAGKTDFAVFGAIERMKKLWVDREVEEWIETETANNNQEPSSEEIKKQIRLIKEKYDKGVENNDEEIMEKVRPYLIAGSKDFSLQDLYVEKTLTTKNIFNTTDALGHSKEIDNLLLEWREKNKEKLSELSQEERDRVYQQEAQRLTEIYLKQKEGFGMHVDKIKKDLLRAIEDGKPIIIDEVNAIPATLLISMNDILTARQGKTAYVPGYGKVEVKEGFSIIMTGNLNNSPLADYVGTEELNPAFLSRLRLREYDYLPQNDSGSVFEQEDPENNELFQVMIAFLSKKDGSLKLPNNSMEKIFALTQLATRTQRIFAGKWKESDMRKSSGDSLGKEPALEKAVLSVRNLIAVLNEWNKGREKDLDKALWDAFVSGVSNPQDQYLIFNLAQEMGFFRDSNWKEATWDDLSDRETTLLWNDVAQISEDKYKELYQIPDNHYYSPRQVMELLYGEAPERMRFPDVDLEKLANGEIDITVEIINEMNDFIDESLKYEKGIEVALKKENCLEESK